MELIELQQCLDQETADETIRILKNEGILFRKGSGQPAYDVSSLGGSSETANQKIIISVAPSDYQQARVAMEADALLIKLPDDYHLYSAASEELQEIVREADEWSPFDVAHAKRLLDEMGVEIEDPEVLAERRLTNLKEGKKAPVPMLVLSVLLPVLGIATTITILSVIGCGIALSIAFMKSKTVEGRFYTYNKRSRGFGKVAVILALAVTVAGFYIWGQFVRYGDYDLYIPAY